MLKPQAKINNGTSIYILAYMTDIQIRNVSLKGKKLTEKS
jgi:hypothetical protein